MEVSNTDFFAVDKILCAWFDHFNRWHFLRVDLTQVMLSR